MEFFREWLLGVVACAMLGSLLYWLCPDGAARQVARFTLALLLLCAMLRPLAALQLPDLAWDAARYREAAALLEAELERGYETALADGIARELEAYIEDKADGLGANVRATVALDARCAPERVTLYGRYSAALADWIASELGVAKERQTWIDGG
ncbi:MAG: hypothetical protein IJT71_00210 [Oscillospiraceae bacterium]|nr:hypothetical protein [Oscillospiraceae bacterium]